MPQIDLGKVVGDTGVSLRFRGEWNNAAEYVNGSNYIDLATHNGSLWICDSTNTNQEPSISSEYWSVAAQGMAENPIIYKSESGDFPLTGEEGILYVDDTISPALMYIWNGSKYIPAGGSGEIAAADVAYNNDSSGLTAENVQNAIDESVGIIKLVKANQADAYDPEATYTQGDYCIENNTLYKANQDISVAEAWTPEHWTQTTVGDELSGVNSSLGSWKRIINMSVEANNTYDVDLPERKALLASVENSYGVGCLYFIQTSDSSFGANATVYPLAKNSNYFNIESISGQSAKVKVTPGAADGTLRVYSF